MGPLHDSPIGIYEKALAPDSWPRMLTAARTAGFDFVEMSIDESDARLSRLQWTRRQRSEVARASAEHETPIYSICLSGHRRYGLGSAAPEVRARAREMLDQAVGLACDLGVRVVQIAGYHSFYEVPDPATRDRYVDGIRDGVRLAAARGVMLAVENIDTGDMASISDCLRLRAEVDSPWFQVYPDVGNLVVNGCAVEPELRLLPGAAVGLHLKDARRGEPRRVPFGAGAVPFVDVFRTLHEIAYRGPFTIEMWNDDPAAANDAAIEAREWIRERMDDAVKPRIGVAPGDRIDSRPGGARADGEAWQ
jgi:L-ribulose-5-phosphate 3-epimerase